MNHNDINATLDHAEQLWPGRIKDAHREACYQSWDKLNISHEQARIALNALAVQFKGYLTVAHIDERLRSLAYANTPNDRESRKHAEREAKARADEEHRQRVEIDDAATLRWVSHLDQADIDELARYIAETGGPMGRSLLGLPGGKVTKEHAMTRPNVRALLHAAERRLAAKFREAA